MLVLLYDVWCMKWDCLKIGSYYKRIVKYSVLMICPLYQFDRDPNSFNQNQYNKLVCAFSFEIAFGEHPYNKDDLT